MQIRRSLLASTLGLAALVSAATHGGPVLAQGDPPGCVTAVAYPDSLNIGSPPSGVSSAQAALFGVWEGTWTSQFGTLPGRLIVEQMEPDGRTSGTYTWGSGGSTQAGVTRWQGQTSPDGRLDWAGGGGTRFSFTVQQDGRVQGTREQNGGIAQVSMTRCTWQ